MFSSQTMRLSRLLNVLPEKKTRGEGTDPEISAICYDSRQMKPGGLFVAIPGFHVDGHKFVSDAVQRGAAAILVQNERALDALQEVDAPDLPSIVVSDSRRALADLSVAFYGYPSRKLRLIGITGTDGKTTTSYLINTVLEQAGFRTGLIGTVDFKIDNRRWANDTRQTTPEAPEIQEMLAQMVTEGVDYAIVESTSHALALDRVTGCDYDVAVFTNLTSDHLDFHKTREQYLRDKGRLFTLLSQSYDKGLPKVRILNADDESFDYLRTLGSAHLISYGVEQPATVLATSIRVSSTGLGFSIVLPGNEIDINLKLMGRFNVYNALATFATGISQGIDIQVIKEALESVSGVPGRMERIEGGQPFTVIVDYAHTPDSLEKVLRMLRPLTLGRILLVFGCAGERDTQKRPKMGEIAARLSDFFVLTNEDPRLEDPEAIVAEIETGAKAAGKKVGQDYDRILDRREAIRQAFERAQSGDLVLLAGKGHEQCIIVGNEKIPWDDRAVARELLAGMGLLTS